MNERYQVQVESLPWQGDIAELVEHGQLDLVQHIDDRLLPSHFLSERLYREDWICAVARDSSFGDQLTLKQYIGASHIVVSMLAGADDSGQAANCSWSKTQIFYSYAILRRRLAMPS